MRSLALELTLSFTVLKNQTATAAPIATAAEFAVVGSRPAPAASVAFVPHLLGRERPSGGAHGRVRPGENGAHRQVALAARPRGRCRGPRPAAVAGLQQLPRVQNAAEIAQKGAVSTRKLKMVSQISR